ncbi:MON2 [Sanghuangporus sanghuang]
MSSIAFLVTELQSLSSETRRKHSDVRDAAEKAISILRNLPDQSTSRLSEDGAQAEELLRPIFMGCATKNTKVIAISMGALQRLIALHAVPQKAVPTIINTMDECMSQGVDIQLRILQTLLSLITNFQTIHGQLLGDALLLCFRMQESRIAVVSSTAAATLRQLVMFIIDKVVDEDRRDNLTPSQLTETVLPDGTHKALGPSALDAYSIVEDLCLLANSEKPHFLRLGALPKTFALELIESVLTNYHDLFRQHNELLVLLQHHLCPLLLKLMSDRPLFPLTLRATRVVFILLKQFSTEFITESEVFLSLLIKIIGGESESGSSEGSSRPLWMRVLAMEIIRGLCNDAELMRRVWERYDSQKDGTKLFGSLISVLKRLVTERPALLGVSAQMFGIGVSSHHADQSTPAGGGGYGFDVGTVAGIVANAATTVVGKMGGDHGLDIVNSSMKLQCIDQLDKADAPPIPDSYIYLLGLQCLVSISEGFASLTLPLFNSIVVQRSKSAGELTIKAPPALDVFALSEEQPSTRVLCSVHGMVDNGWPGMLAALSFLIATNLSDELFGDVLQSYQNLANVAGMLGLTTPRDAFLSSLAKFAIPSRVVSSLEAYIEPPTPRSSSALQEGFSSLSGGTPQPPGLSERNMACLKVLIASALFLAGGLGASWYNIFETLQNAEYVLTAKGQKQIPAKRTSASPSVGTTGRSVSSSASNATASTVSSPPRHILLSDLDSEGTQRAIQRLFDSTKNLEDSAFHDFVSALCKLSAEMIEMQSDAGAPVVETGSVESVHTLSASASSETAHRRRVSGIHLPRTLRTGDFSINKLGSISRLNIVRFTSRSPDIAWTVVMNHLVAVLRNRVAPHPIRLQAARTLDDVLLIVPRNIGSSEERKKSVQRLMLEVLAEQVSPDPITGNNTTVVEIRKMGLETFHQILQFAGHTLVVGWEIIFEMLGSACEPTSMSTLASIPESAATSPTASPQPSKPSPLQYSAVSDRGSAVLVRIAFQSLTLVCDSLSALSPEHLRLCISTIGRFGRQADTNISLTAAGSLLWGVSDSIQTRRKNSEHEEEYNALWMLLLLEMLGLCTDPRSEVRVGAIQTLFRTLQLYGASLSLETWDEILWKVAFPLLDSLTDAMKQVGTPVLSSSASGPVPVSDTTQAWDESKTLALQSLGSIFNDFLAIKFIHLDSFERVWDTFVTQIQTSFMFDSAPSCTASLRCLEKATNAAIPTSSDTIERVKVAWQRVWTACDNMGQLILRRTRPPHNMSAVSSPPFHQDSLLAFVDVVRATRSLRREKEGCEWDIDHLTRLMAILKGVLTYPDSPSYRPDIDDLTPVQAAVVETINDIDLSVPGATSLVLRALSELLTLPYLGAFDIQDANNDASRPIKDSRMLKRVTYIALTKKVMPMLRDTFLRFKDADIIYIDGTLEAIFSAYAVPIKLKYECPAPSKFGNDLPLWKSATSAFLLIVRETTQRLRTAGTEIPDERIESIWRQLIDAFRGCILADCRSLDNLPLEEQEAEETFDISLIAAIETDVVPYVGDARVPDNVIVQLAKMLLQGSLVHVTEDTSLHEHHSTPRSSSVSDQSASPTAVEHAGFTVGVPITSRERFSYWCLDLLFLICSDVVKDEEPLRRRIAALSLPTLLQRCSTTLLSYLADEKLRGHYPFPRAREEELVYILKKLLSLRLWPGSLWAALSSSPSTFCSEQPAVEANLSPPQLFAEATKRSSIAHLFQLYTPICQIAALSRNPPVAWAPVLLYGASPKGNSSPLATDSKSGRSSFVAANATSGNAEELDGRTLASACLAEIGKEMRVS